MMKEYQKQRLFELKKLIKAQALDAVLISTVTDIIYLTGFTYFSNIEREGYLFITKNAQFIITDARYSHAVRTHVKDFELIEISAGRRFDEIIKELCDKYKIQKIGFDERNLSVFEYKKLNGISTKHFSLSPLRAIKDEAEIARIKKACEIGDRAFSEIIKYIKLGITEKEIEIILERIIKNDKAEFSFPAIVAFGENSAVPHHKTGMRKLKLNEFVLLDFGVKFENYCSDMTRTVFYGRANEEQKKVYQTVLEAQNHAIKALDSCFLIHNSSPKKAAASQIDNAARSYITAKDYPSIPHSLGHGIGLEVHESPSLSPGSKDELRNGMVFSIEPGIYLPDKYGVRIEDLCAVQDNKLLSMTRSDKKFVEIS